MLKPQVKKFVLENLSNTDFDPETSIESYRAGIKADIAKADKGFSDSAKYPTKVTIEKLEILTDFGKTTIYIYRPPVFSSEKDESKGTEIIPCIIYFTGSGFVYSNPTWQSRNCIDLAQQTNSIVINIKEKTAPEHKFPAGLNECFSVVKWLFSNGKNVGVDVDNISLCGFSSGGNFAAVLARWCMEKSLPITGQYLISPWLDLTCRHASYDEFSQGYLLDKPVCDWLRRQYTEGAQYLYPDISPLLCKEDLSRIAPCTIVVAKCEPFRDECYAYAKLLQAHHVPVRFTCIPGQIHEYGGCNRWRLAVTEAEDPIVPIISAIHATRVE